MGLFSIFTSAVPGPHTHPAAFLASIEDSFHLMRYATLRSYCESVVQLLLTGLWVLCHGDRFASIEGSRTAVLFNSLGLHHLD